MGEETRFDNRGAAGLDELLRLVPDALGELDTGAGANQISGTIAKIKGVLAQNPEAAARLGESFAIIRRTTASWNRGHDLILNLVAGVVIGLSKKRECADG